MRCFRDSIVLVMNLLVSRFAVDLILIELFIECCEVCYFYFILLGRKLVDSRSLLEALKRI